MSSAKNKPEYNRHKPLCFFALLLLMHSSQLVDAQIYRWQDDSGKYQYSDKPHPGATLIKQADEKKPDIISSLPENEPEATPIPTTGKATNTQQAQNSAPATAPTTTAAKLTTTPRPTTTPRSTTTPKTTTTRSATRMSESDQTRLKELSRKHKRCASSRTRLNKLQTQYQQRKLESAPEQTLNYLQRSIDRQNKLVSRDCQ